VEWLTNISGPTSRRRLGKSKWEQSLSAGLNIGSGSRAWLACLCYAEIRVKIWVLLIRRITFGNFGRCRSLDFILIQWSRMHHSRPIGASRHAAKYSRWYLTTIFRSNRASFLLYGWQIGLGFEWKSQWEWMILVAIMELAEEWSPCLFLRKRRFLIYLTNPAIWQMDVMCKFSLVDIKAEILPGVGKRGHEKTDFLNSAHQPEHTAAIGCRDTTWVMFQWVME